MKIYLIVMGKRPYGSECRNGRNDAKEYIADDRKIGSGDKVCIPFVVTADHDKTTLRYAV